MKKNKSKKPSKQRSFLVNAPLHLKRKFLTTNLSKELRKKYNRRNVQVRKGDTVKILRGQYKKISGKISKVFVKKSRVYVEGAENIKKDGSKTFYPIHPSKIMITELNLDDKKRQKLLARTKPKK